VKDIDSFYERFRHSPALAVPLQKQPWGIKEFYLQDPSGNFLKFGEAIEEKS